MSKPDPFWIKYLPKYFQTKISGRAVVHAVIHNSSWLIVDKIFRALLGLFVGAWVARYLGPADFGTLSYVIAYIAFFQAFSALGLDTIVIREIARHPKLAPFMLGSALLMRLCSSLIAFLVASVSVGFFYGWESQLFWITVIISSSLAFQSSDTIDLWFQSQSRNRLTVIVKLAAYVVSNGLKIIGILLGAPLVYFAALVTVEVMLIMVGLVICYKKNPAAGDWNASRSVMKKLFMESWPFLLSGVCVIIYMRFDQILIKSFLGEASLGVYAAALPIASVWNALPVAICAGIAPFLARIRLQNPAKYKQVLQLIFKYLFMFSLLLSVLIGFFSDAIIDVLYGPAYADASMVLRVYIFTSIPVFLGVAQTLWITNEGRSVVALKNTLLGGICAISMNFVLIPQFGLVGAAMAAVIAYFASAVVGNFFFCRELFLLQMGLKNK
jgi:O-antigen/teichoic acid export membrane protein